MNWTGVAYAMGSFGQGGDAQGAGGIAAFLPLLLMVGIFYFLLIRPQQKKQKDHKAMLDSLQRGDVVVTTGGIQGKITGLTETVATVEIAEKVRVKVQRGYIAGVISKGEPEE